MANTRYVTTSFWEDSKVQNLATPEDKYFMLYLLTNPHTTQIGCYEITKRTISFETGYTTETIENLLRRMEKDFDFIVYDEKTNEILIKNWYKYNWTSSPKVKNYLLKEIMNIKCKRLLDLINEKLEEVYKIETPKREEKEETGYPIDTLSIPYGYPIDTPSQIKEKKIKEKEIKENNNKKNIYEIFEEEFGRTLSPIEYEIIAKMISDYSEEFIKLALSEAVSRQASSLKYVEKVLLNWKSRNLKTEEEVKNYIKNFNELKSTGSEDREYYRSLDE